MPYSCDPPLASSSGLTSLLLATALAVGATLAGGDGPAPWILLSALAFLVVGLPGIGPAGPGLLKRLGRRAAAVALGTLAGLTLAAFQHARDGVPELLRIWEKHGFEARLSPVELRGRLRTVHLLPGRRARLRIDLHSFRLPGRPPFEGLVQRRVVVRLGVPLPADRTLPPWKPGDLVEVTARLGPPHGPRNPGGFDYRRYLKARGVGLVGTCKSARLVKSMTGQRRVLFDIFPGIRRRVVARLRRASGPEGEATAGFLAALLVGERARVPADLAESLRRAGVYHVLALSGLHVGVLIGLFSAALRLIPLRPAARRWLLILAVGLYWAIVRDSGSIARSAWMATIYLGGALLQRRVSAAGVVAVSAVLLLLNNPAWVADTGFLLTFAATLGILGAAWRAGPMDAREPGRLLHPLRCWILRPLGISSAALMATAPLTARYFHIMAPGAILANLFVVPASALLLWLALGATLLQPLLPFAAGGLCRIAGWVTGWLEELARLVAAPAAMSFRVLPPTTGLVVSCGVLLVLAGAARHGPLRRTLLGVMIACLAWTAWNGRGSELRPTGNLEVTALDVGQGDSILVRFPTGATLLVDAGGLGGPGFDVGARVVAPALRSLGLLRLDVLAVTHAHRDHLAGAMAILEDFEPRAVWLGRMPCRDPLVRKFVDMATARGIPLLFPRRGVRLAIGGASLEVLNPRGAGAAGKRQNNNSLVLRLSFRTREALLMGDLEGPLEAELVAEGTRLRAGLLKVGHHGSDSSTTPAFLRRVAPRFAVISVGATNPWGHPDRAVLDRLTGAGTRIFRTDRYGAIRFETDGVRCWRVAPHVGGPQNAPGLRKRPG